MGGLPASWLLIPATRVPNPSKIPMPREAVAMSALRTNDCADAQAFAHANGGGRFAERVPTSTYSTRASPGPIVRLRGS